MVHDVQVHTTVSHWTLIHSNCHEAARRADARLRVAKSEWDGAALRNSGTRTNNLLPVCPWRCAHLLLVHRPMQSSLLQSSLLHVTKHAQEQDKSPRGCSLQGLGCSLAQPATASKGASKASGAVQTLCACDTCRPHMPRSLQAYMHTLQLASAGWHCCVRQAARLQQLKLMVSNASHSLCTHAIFVLAHWRGACLCCRQHPGCTAAGVVMDRYQRPCAVQIWGGETAEVEYVSAAADFLDRAALGVSGSSSRRRTSAAADEPLTSLHLVSPLSASALPCLA